MNKFLSHGVLASTLFLSFSGYATNISTDINVTTTTGAPQDGTVHILKTGSIQVAANDAVQLNTMGGMVIVDPLNHMGVNAIQSTLGNGVHISQPQGTITIGAGSGVSITPAGAGVAILIDANVGQNTTITNAGTITGGVNEAIQIGVGADNISLTNNASGLIQSGLGTTKPTIDFLPGLTGGTLTNFGTIQQLTAPDQSAIHISGAANINAINNEATGVIQSVSATAATIRNMSQIRHELTNLGKISNIAGLAIDFSGPVGGRIHQAGGLITGNVHVGAFNFDGISTDGYVFNMTDGMIVGNVISGINNLHPRLFTLSGGTLQGDFDGSAGTLANTFEISGGQVTGLVRLGTKADVVDLTGGTLSQGILGQHAGQILNVNATYTGFGAGAPVNKVDNINVNNAGTVFTLLGQIINIGAPGGVTINSGTTLAMGTGSLIQGKSGTFVSPNGKLAAIGAATIDLTGSAAFVDVNNAGIVNLTRGGALTIIGPNPRTFTNQPGSVLQTDMGMLTPGGPLGAGIMKLTSNPILNGNIGDLKAGSAVSVNVQGVILKGVSADIVIPTQGGDTIVDNSLMLQPLSPVVRFIKTGGNAPGVPITLTAVNNSFTTFGGSTNSGIGAFLDSISTVGGPIDANFFTLLAVLQGLQTAQDVADAQTSLTPVGMNGSLLLSSIASMTAVFDAVSDRRADRRTARSQLRWQGLNFGDAGGPAGSQAMWMKGLQGNIDQDERNNIAGFDSRFGGIALGFDWGYNDCAAFGVAGSYIRTNLKDDAQNPKDFSVNSWQISPYGWIEYSHGVYLEGTLAYGWNEYETNRSIGISTLFGTAAQANFNGNQWGGQADLGWRIEVHNSAYFTPFARLRYIQGETEAYTESGAGFLNLAVNNNDNYHEFLGGVGIRLGTRVEAGYLVWMPSITALVGYDFDVGGSSLLAAFQSFTVGPNSFTTNGVIPGRTVFDLGVGVSAYAGERASLAFKMDFEFRDQYVGNAVSLQYYYSFA